MARILSPMPHAVVPASIFANGWPRGAAIFPSLQFGRKWCVSDERSLLWVFYNLTIFYMLGGIPDTAYHIRLKLNMALDEYPVV